MEKRKKREEEEKKAKQNKTFREAMIQAYVPIGKRRNRQAMDPEAQIDHRLQLQYGKQDTLGEITKGI